MQTRSTPPTPSPDSVSLGRIFRLWYPLALSWLCMAIELPLVTAVLGRMPGAEIQLAAVGSIAFPLALLIEGPVVMLLSASTALCKDAQSFQRVRRYAMFLGVALSGVHALVCLPFLYEPIVGGLIGAEGPVLRAGHPALWALIPWTAAIAYRRFYQGILIRAERGRHVTQGTLVRLACSTLALTLGYQLGLSGALTAGFALSTGVIGEAAFIGWVVRPSVRELLAKSGVAGEALTFIRFVRFYTPLAITPIIGFLALPLGAAAMNRMPFQIESLAVWQALHGLVFIPRSLALAYNEVVIRLSELPGSMRPLLTFTRYLAVGNTLVLGAFALSPLGAKLFEWMFHLPPTLAILGWAGLLLSLPQPGLLAGQSFHLGWLVGRGKTRAVTVSMSLYLVVAAVCLLWLSPRDAHAGLLYVAGTFTIATVIQVAFLSWQSRSLRLDPST